MFPLQCSFYLTWYLSHAPHVVPVITLASGRFGHTKVQFFSSTKGHIPVLGNLTHIGGVDVVSYNYLPELLMVQVPKISSWCQKIMNERRTWTFLISLFWCKNKRLVREKTSPGLEENTFLDFINEPRNTELNWLHCQRTHSYSTQPVPKMPRHMELFNCDWYCPGFHEGENNDHFSVNFWSSVSMILLSGWILVHRCCNCTNITI